MSRLRVVVVVNGRRRGRRTLGLERSLAGLGERTQVAATLDTRGDASDAGRIVALLSDAGPDVLVAAGGDGTAALALRALLRGEAPFPAGARIPAVRHGQQHGRPQIFGRGGLWAWQSPLHEL